MSKYKNKFRQVLIDMPFSLIECAAFGISQLKTYLDISCKDLVETDILYFNHDFYFFFGEEIYNYVNHDFFNFYKFHNNKHLWVDNLRKSGLEVEYYNGMLGDWIFREAAFPKLIDNAEVYFKKYNYDPRIQSLIHQRRKEIDAFLESLIVKYDLLRYDIIGFTSRFQQLTSALALARILKSKKPDIIITIGGPNCEPPAGSIIAKNCKNIDYVMSGRRFLHGYKEFLYQLASGTVDMKKITGLFSYEEGKVNGFANCDIYGISDEDDINDLLEINYDSYFESLKRHGLQDIVHPVLFFETSRGCSWGEQSRCAFCAIDGYNPAHRIMSDTAAKKYLNFIFHKYGPMKPYYVFVDSSLPKQYIKNVFPTVDVPKDSLLLYEARADLNNEQLELLAKANVRLLIVGIESLSTNILKLLNKGMTAFDNIKFLKRCRVHRIAVNWNILVGVPGETDEMIQENVQAVQLVHHLYPPTGVWLISFQGNCDYNTNSEKYNIEVKPSIEGLTYIYPFSQNDLKTITYFYERIDSDIVGSRAVQIQKLSKRALKWKDLWYKAEEGEAPDLCFENNDGAIIIKDARQGSTSYISISNLEYEILMYMNAEKTLDEMNKRFSNECNVAQILENFKKKKLVFSEDGVYISLVINYRNCDMTEI